MKYLIAIDEGTTSCRAILYNLETKRIENSKSVELSQIYPKPTYVEENANEIYSGAISALVEMIESANIDDILGIGITNQRETVIAWDKTTGKPLYNAIVWQCRRTAEFCEKLKPQYSEIIKQKTGLIIDSYFSASKIKWLIDNVPEVKKQMLKNNLCVGTVDSYLIYKLTNGKSFVTDYTNASRTMLFNINTLKWDSELLQLFGIDENILPKVVSSDTVVGNYSYNQKLIPIAGIAGDQQSALFGQACFLEGSCKITYGTGLFMLYNIGNKPIISDSGMLTTIAYSVGNQITYALEGSVFNAGSAVMWLRDNLNFFENSSESELLATRVKNSNGVYIVPAFTGLGAPYWNSECKGIITGLTRGVTKEHITRATLEAIALSSKDVASVMENDSKIKLKEIRCDGGASNNNFLMQIQSDILNVNLNRPIEKESTALGAIYLCAIALGLLKQNEIENLRQVDKIFTPTLDRDEVIGLYKGWKNAIRRCLDE